MDRSVTALLVPDEVGPNPANVSARGVVVGTRPDLPHEAPGSAAQRFVQTKPPFLI